ncbi:MAG: YidC/Oxa1 family membrane protein insertase [Actinomycetota bacterium]
MFDGLFEVIAKTLSVFYDLVPNYAVAIAMLTLVVMVVTTPFTLKGTRSMIQMQRLQPEMRRLQLKYKDDRQKLNEELMAFYKENQLNPLGGCLPLLLQAPIFMILFNVIQGLTRVQDGTFNPKHLDQSSPLFQALDPVNEMLAFGVDLAESASSALSEGFVHGLPHLVMVAIVAVSSYYQQKQIQGRNPNMEVPPQQKMLMRLMPAMFVFFAFVSPAALVVYFVTSNLYRIGMQHYITRTLYHGEDSLGAQAQKASLEAKKLRDEGGGDDLLPRLGRKNKASEQAPEASGNGPSPKQQAPKPPSATARTGAQNRSKKKKKRR